MNVYSQIIQNTNHQVESDTIFSEIETLLMVYQEDIINAYLAEFIKAKEKMFAFTKKFLLERDSHLTNQEEFELRLSQGLSNTLAKLEPQSEYFKAFSSALVGLKVFKNPKYCHKLLDIISDFKSTVDVNYGSFELFESVLDKINSSSPYYRDGSSPSSFIRFFNHVISKKLVDIESEPTRAKIFQIVAGISPSVRDTEIKTTLEEIYTILESNLPLPSDTAKIYFSSLEPLLFSFHQLGFKSVGSLPTVCGLSVDGTPLNEEEKAKKEILLRRVNFAFTQSGEFIKQLKSKLSSSNREESDKINRFIGVVDNVRKLLELLKHGKPKLLPGSNEKLTPSWKATKKVDNKKTDKKKDNNQGDQSKDKKRKFQQPQGAKTGQKKQKTVKGGGEKNFNKNKGNFQKKWKK